MIQDSQSEETLIIPPQIETASIKKRPRDAYWNEVYQRRVAF